MKTLMILFLLLCSLLGKGQTIAVVNMDSIVAHHPLADQVYMQQTHEAYFDNINVLTEDTREMLEYLEYAINTLDVTDMDRAIKQFDSLHLVYNDLSSIVDSFFSAYQDDYADLVLNDTLIASLAQAQEVDYVISSHDLLYYNSSMATDLTYEIMRQLDQRSTKDYQTQVDQLTYRHLTRFYQFAYPEDFNHSLYLLQRLCPIYLPY